MRKPASTKQSAPLLAMALALTSVPLACALEGADEPDVPGTTNNNGQGGVGNGDGSGNNGNSGAGEPDCVYTGPSPLDVTTLDPCPNCAVGGAHCLPNGLVPPEFLDQLDDCDADNKCVPDKFIETTGLFIAETCTSVAGAEGRCLSPCIPEIAVQAALLPADICTNGDVCAPCYDPTTGQSTSACELSCDPGPTEPPTVLPPCCGGEGLCVPPDAAGEQASQLGEDSCPQDNGPLLCAPNIFVNDPNWKPPACTTSLLSMLLGSEYGPGACLPECIPAVDNFMIAQDGCADGFKCAPCLTPLSGEPSGACDL